MELILLRDRLVCGINNPGIQRRLLSEDNLDFKKAYDLALAMEAAAKNSRTLQQASNSPSLETPVEDVRKIRKQFTSSKHPQSRTQTATRTCTRCGARNHPASRCKYRTVKCYNCSKVSDVRRWGHAAKNVSTFSNPKSGNGFALGLCAVR